jgi:hypothetical protein
MKAVLSTILASLACVPMPPAGAAAADTPKRVTVTGGAGYKTSLGTCKYYVPAAIDVGANADIAFNAEPDIVVLQSVSRVESGRAP